MKEKRIHELNKFITNSVYGNIGSVDNEMIKTTKKFLAEEMSIDKYKIFDVDVFEFENGIKDYYLGIDSLNESQFNDYIINQKIKLIKDL